MVFRKIIKVFFRAFFGISSAVLEKRSSRRNRAPVCPRSFAFSVWKRADGRRGAPYPYEQCRKLQRAACELFANCSLKIYDKGENDELCNRLTEERCLIQSTRIWYLICRKNAIPHRLFYKHYLIVSFSCLYMPVLNSKLTNHSFSNWLLYNSE